MIRRLPLLLVPLLLGAVARAGPPFATDDPESLPYRHGEAYLFAAGSRSAGGTALNAGPGIELNYSFMPNTFAHLVVPVARVNPQGAPSTSGLGDVELGFKWQMLHQDKFVADVGIFPLVELPTGSARRGLGAGHTQYFLPVWLQKDLGSWTSYGGGGYWVNPGAGNRNWWFSGLLLQRQLSANLFLGGEIFHSTPQEEGGRSSTGFNLGGGWQFVGPYQLLFTTGRNITNVDDNRFSAYLGLYRTF